MKKAKLALMAVSLSYILTGSTAQAANEPKAMIEQNVAQEAISTESGVSSDTQPNPSIANLTQLALGGMSDLGGILTSDLPAPPNQAMSDSSGRLDQVAIGGASDAAPSFGQQMSGAQSSLQGSSRPGMCGAGMPPRPGFGMHPMLGHYRCPWEKLEGANALTDAQYQKLYDIKGQFIASIVPKGLNVWMLSRKMKDLLNVGDVDMNAVKDVEKQIAAATSDLSMTAMDSIITANQVLTAEQRKELHKMSIRSTLGGGGHHHDKDSHPDK